MVHGNPPFGELNPSAHSGARHCSTLMLPGGEEGDAAGHDTQVTAEMAPMALE
jgi:hypothetical protein